MFSVFIAKVWAKVWPYITLIAAAFAAFFGIRQAGKAAGKQEAQTEAIKRDQQAMREANTVAREVDQLDDDSLVDEFDRLRDARRR